MSQDNVRLALWISGVWGIVIMIIVGIEAIVHDGEIAATVVDTFSKVLFGLAAILGAITGLGKMFETKQAISATIAPSEPANDPAGVTVDGAGV